MIDGATYRCCFEGFLSSCNFSIFLEIEQKQTAKENDCSGNTEEQSVAKRWTVGVYLVDDCVVGGGPSARLWV